MLSIDDIYQLVQKLANKYKQGYLSPDEFNQFFNSAQRELYNSIIGLPESYQFGKPIARISKGFSKTIEEKLAPFIKESNITIASSNGQVTKPSDFSRHISLRMSNDMVRIRRVYADRLAAAMSNSINPPSLSAPIYTEFPQYYQFYPKSGWTTQTCNLTYYQLPPIATWAYTLDVNNLPVYNSASSIQPLWLDTEKNDLIQRTLQYFGVNLSNQFIEQYSQQQKQEGQ